MTGHRRTGPFAAPATALEVLDDVCAALHEWGWYPAGRDPGKAPYSIMGHARTALGVNGPVTAPQSVILLRVSDALRHAIGRTVGLYMTVADWERDYCTGPEHAITLCRAAQRWLTDART